MADFKVSFGELGSTTVGGTDNYVVAVRLARRKLGLNNVPLAYLIGIASVKKVNSRGYGGRRKLIDMEESGD